MKKLSVLFLMIAVLLNGQVLNANEEENVCDSKTCLDGKKLDHTGDWQDQTSLRIFIELF